MSTSAEKGAILGVPSTSASLATLPVRASTWRGVANNANHLADELSRVLVSYPQYSTSAGGLTVAVASTWTPIHSFGPFPLLVGADGVPYPVRVRVGGRSALGGSCKIRIGVCPVGQAAELMSATTLGAGVVETAAFTDAVNAWRTTTTTVTLDAVWSSLLVSDAVSGASPGDVVAVLATVEVWGYSAVSDVYCTQAYAAEQVAL